MNNETIRDIIFDALLAAGIAAQLYFILDQITDGRSSTEISMFVYKYKQKVKNFYERERVVRRDRGRVVFDAITIVDNSEAE